MISSAYCQVVDSYVPIFIPVIFSLAFKLIERISEAMIKRNADKGRHYLMPVFIARFVECKSLFIIVIVGSV